MQLFKNKDDQVRNDDCDSRLNDPQRLEAVRKTRLIDTPKDKVFDRLTNLAAKLMRAPITIVSIIDNHKQFYKAAHGLPSPLSEIREVPIDGSLCKYTLAGESIISDDVENFSLLKDHPTVLAFGIKSFISVPLIDGQGNVLGSFCAVDMNKRKWTEDDVHFLKELSTSVLTEINLRQQIFDLETEKVFRKSFVEALTHDLRTPLASARLSAEILLRKHVEPHTKDKLNRIVGNIQRGDRMIQELLDSHRNQGSGTSVQFTDCSMNEILESTLNEMKEIWGERFVLKSSGTVRGVWDKEVLGRVFENLLSNAVKYGSEETEITVELSQVAESVTVSVHNFGDVISANDQKNIFLPHHRGEVKVSKPMGWGIGLTFVKDALETHLGKVSVTSSKDEGTSFIVQLPLNPNL